MEDELKLIDAYLDGELTPESAAALVAWLRADTDNLETFVRKTHLHRQLRDALCGQASQRPVAVADPNDSPPDSPALGFLADAFRQGRDYFSHPTPLSTLVAVATIGSLLTLLAIWAAPLYRRNSAPRPEPLVQPEYVARLTRMIDCQWAEGSLAPMPGVHLRAGRQLELVEGLAEIEFKCGTVVILESPATFQPESENVGFLQIGKLTALVPERARGFVIQSPNITVVDLGTEFAVHVEKAGASEVYVFQGEVEVEFTQQTTIKQRLVAGTAARFAASGTEVTRMPTDAKRFKRSRQIVAGVLRVSGAVEFLETAPKSLAPGRLEDDRAVFLFLERENVALPQEIQGVIVSPRGRTLTREVRAAVPAGTRVDSYLLHFDPKGVSKSSSGKHAAGSVTFSRPVLGIIVDDGSLDASDGVFGRAGTITPAKKTVRGCEPGSLQSTDRFALSADRHVLKLDLRAAGAIDQARVLVASARER